MFPSRTSDHPAATVDGELIHLPAAQWLAAAGAVLNPAVADPGGPGNRPISSTPALLAAARHNSGLPAWLGTLLMLRVRSHPS